MQDRTGPNHLEDRLVQYHACDIRTQTFGWPMPENEVASAFHLFDGDLVIFEPSLRSKNLGVIPVDRIALCAPRVEANQRSSRDPIAMDVISLGRRYSISKLRQRRMYAEAFLDAGLKIRQFTSFPFFYGNSDLAISDGIIYFVL